jgi:O-antigen ligase
LNLKNQILFYSLAFYILSIPYNIQVNNVALIVLLGAIFINNSVKNIYQQVKQSLISKLFFVLYALYVVHAVVNSFNQDELFNLDQKLLIVAIPILFSGISINKLIEKSLNLLKISFLISISVCIAFALKDYQTTKDYNEFLYLKLIDNIKFHVIEYSLFLAVLGFISLNDLFKRTGNKTLNIIAVITFSITIIALSVRGTILVYFSLLLIYFITYYWKQKQFLKALLVPLLTLTIGITTVYNIPTLKSRFHRVLTSKTELEKHGRLNGLSGRMVIWKNASNVLKEHWVWGVSPSNVQHKLNEEYKKDVHAKEALTFNYNCHNQYLQTFIGIGIIGFILLMSIQVRTLLASIKSKKITLILISILLLISPLTEALMEINKGLLFFVFFHLYIEYQSKNKIAQ